MKQTFFHIIIILCFSCCKDNEGKIQNTEIQKNKNSVAIDNEKDSVGSNSNIDTNPEEVPEKIGIVYVTAKNGLVWREKPNIKSNKLGTFDFGSKLELIGNTGINFEVNDNGKKIKGNWIQVRFKNFGRGGKIESQVGYVFDGFTVDSLNVDFSKIPTDVGFIWNSKLLEKATIEYEELNLSFSKTTVTQFKQSSSLNSRKEENTTELQPLANFGNPQEGGYFLIKTNKNIIKFPCGKNYGRPCYTYSGSIKYLNSYIISSLGDGMAESFLLDADNNSLLPIPSGYDDGNYLLSISPSKEKLIVTSSIDYDRFKEFYSARSNIIIFDIKNIKNLSDIKKAYSFSSKDWEIAGVNWINDKSFVLKVFDETRKDDNGMDTPINSKYLRTTME